MLSAVEAASPAAAAAADGPRLDVGDAFISDSADSYGPTLQLSTELRRSSLRTLATDVVDDILPLPTSANGKPTLQLSEGLCESSLRTLATDALDIVGSFLDLQGLASTMRTCQALHAVCDADTLWSRFAPEFVLGNSAWRLGLRVPHSATCTEYAVDVTVEDERETASAVARILLHPNEYMITPEEWSHHDALHAARMDCRAALMKPMGRGHCRRLLAHIRKLTMEQAESAVALTDCWSAVVLAVRLEVTLSKFRAAVVLAFKIAYLFLFVIGQMPRQDQLDIMQLVKTIDQAQRERKSRVRTNRDPFGIGALEDLLLPIRTAFEQEKRQRQLSVLRERLSPMASGGPTNRTLTNYLSRDRQFEVGRKRTAIDKRGSKWLAAGPRRGRQSRR